MSKRMLVLPQLWVYVFLVSVILLPELNAAGTALAQGTAFTYQGKLTDGGSPATGQYDFQLKLFDTATVGTGTQKGPTVAVSNVTVTAGIFTVQLDFGACASCFDGSARFLEIAIKQTSGSTFITLGPRQPVTSNPYAIRSQNAATADGLSLACVNCVTSSQIQSIQGSQVTGNISGSQISGTIPVASVPAGSGQYIQNQNSSAQAANFNISGNGTVAGTLTAGTLTAGPVNAGSVNAGPVNASLFGIGNLVVLSNPGANNLFAGVGAGQSNTAGQGNAFFGFNAGNLNTNAEFNAFFGSNAGREINGNSNSFFGEGTGFNITTGTDNAFFGAGAGNGGPFGRTNSGNTLLGSLADSVDGLTNAAAIGFQAKVTASNSLVLGSINGLNGATADTNVGIGTSTPGSRLVIDTEAARALELIGHSASPNRTTILGISTRGTRTAPTATQVDDVLVGMAGTGHNGSIIQIIPSPGSVLIKAAQNFAASALGTRITFETTSNGTNIPAERMRIDHDGQVGIGTTAPAAMLDIAVSTAHLLLGDTGCAGSAGIGFGSSLTGCADYSMRGDGTNTLINRPTGGFISFRENNSTQMFIATGGQVGIGTTNPDQLLSVNGNASKAVGGGSWATFSDERLKTIHGRYTRGLQALMQLEPIRFEYKTDNALGLRGTGEAIGFSAQKVERILPEAVTRSTSGYLQINNDPIMWTMLNAVKEQQAQIAAQQSQIENQQRFIETQKHQFAKQAELIRRQQQFSRQQHEQSKQQQIVIDGLKKMICLDHPNADFCK